MRPEDYSEGPYLRMIRENKRIQYRNSALLMALCLLVYLGLVCLFDVELRPLAQEIRDVILVGGLAVSYAMMRKYIRLSMQQWTCQGR